MIIRIRWTQIYKRDFTFFTECDFLALLVLFLEAKVATRHRLSMHHKQHTQLSLIFPTSHSIVYPLIWFVILERKELVNRRKHPLYDEQVSPRLSQLPTAVVGRIKTRLYLALLFIISKLFFRDHWQRWAEAQDEGTTNEAEKVRSPTHNVLCQNTPDDEEHLDVEIKKHMLSSCQSRRTHEMNKHEARGPCKGQCMIDSFGHHLTYKQTISINNFIVYAHWKQH
jgi:hypothetical protein